MIPLDWLFNDGKNLKHLFGVIRDSGKKLNGSEFVNMIFLAFWDEFKRKIFIFCFIPFLIHFCLAESYLMFCLISPEE